MDPLQQLGYISGKLEEIASSQERLEDRLNALEKRVNEKFTALETTYKVAKFVGLAAIALATLKWGDLPQIWYSLF